MNDQTFRRHTLIVRQQLTLVRSFMSSSNDETSISDGSFEASLISPVIVIGLDSIVVHCLLEHLIHHKSERVWSVCVCPALG